MKDPLVQLNVRVKQRQHLGKVRKLARSLKRTKNEPTASEIVRRAIDAYDPKLK